MVVVAHSCTSYEQLIRVEGSLDPVRYPLRAQIVMVGARVLQVGAAWTTLRPTDQGSSQAITSF